MDTSPFRPGLEGVVVAETHLSRVDGERGELSYRGRPLGEVVGRGYAPVAHLLWEGSWPGKGEVDGLERGLGAGRLAGFEAARAGGEPMNALMTAVAAADVDPEDRGLIAGAVGGALVGIAGGEEPDPTAEHAADLLRCLRGGVVSRVEAEALGTYLATVADHGLNASTFTARVVASTRSDLRSAVVAGIAALKGPLHGGAPGPVLDMLDAIGEVRSARGWLEGEVAAGRRIMGMGHRVYRVRDPRAAVLERAAAGLRSTRPGRIALARVVEAEAEAFLAERRPGRRLRANVEFYTAVLLEALGIPRHLFSPVFAAGRVIGWLAHATEERATGRIVRPRARYIG